MGPGGADRPEIAQIRVKVPFVARSRKEMGNDVIEDVGRKLVDQWGNLVPAFPKVGDSGGHDVDDGV